MVERPDVVVQPRRAADARAIPSDVTGVPGGAPSRNADARTDVRSHAALPLIVGVTSHRNLAPGELDRLRGQVRQFFGYLQQAFPELPLWVLSPLAAGGDQLVGEEALAVGAHLIAPLPFARELYARDFADPAARARFDSLCAQAQVIELPLLPGTTTDMVAAPGAARDRQYVQAGVFTASHSHILLSLWDGRPSERLGGTAQIVRFHMNGVSPGSAAAHHAPVTLQTGDESLMYHIACSRDEGSAGIESPLPPLQPLQARWVTDDGTSPGGAPMPPEFRRMFARMQQFNTDARRHMAGATAQPSSPSAAPGMDRPTLAAPLFLAADALAIQCQRKVLRAMRGLYALAVLMGIAFVSYSDLPPDLPGTGYAIYVFVVLFAAGAWLAWLAKRRQWHRRYIDYRALSEGLRVQGYWRRAGVGADEYGAFAHGNFMQKQDVELGWIRNAMRAAAIGAIGNPPPDEMTHVIAEWIGEPEGDGQLAYYTHKAGHLQHAHHRTERIARALLAAAIAASLLIAICHRWLGPDTTAWLVAAMGVLAVVAAAGESYAFRKADKDLINQYRYMRAIFGSARRQLDALPDPVSRRAVLRALGEAALAEHAQWALMHRQRPLEAGKL